MSDVNATPNGVPDSAPNGAPNGAPDSDEVTSEQLSLVARLKKPRTIISIILPILLLGLFVKSLPGFKLEELPDKILGANPLLLLAAFVVFYAGFPLRGLRWSAGADSG